MRKLLLASMIMSVLALQGCTRIQTGEVGVRVNMSKEVQPGELMPGSWNQTLIGSVMTFPTKDITVNLENKTPLTADNSALADFDVTVVYGINPSSVAELYSTKSKSFHTYDDKENDTFLMYNYMMTLVNNASYKAVRNYKSLEVADNREKIESEIRSLVMEQLKTEKLDASLNLSVVQVRNVQPNQSILAAATEFVKSQNELKIKENEVELAELESKRMQMLSQNAGSSIAYMNAQANVTLANAVAAGKVQTILIPHGMTMLGALK